MSDAIAVSHGDFGRAALYRLNKPIVMHAHREGHLIFHLQGPDAQINVGGRMHRLCSTQGIAVSPWQAHSFNLTAANDPVLCLVLYIKPIWFLETSETADQGLSFGDATLAMTPQITRRVRLLTSLLMDEEHPAVFDRYLYETTLASFDETWAGHLDGCTIDPGRFTDFRVRRSLRLMQQRFTEGIEMEALARDAGLSRPHFFTLFKRQMGITPNVYLNTLRTEQAIQDLVTTSKSVTDISYELGFSSQASFTRFFASNVGIPPSEYRRVGHQA
ncbi:MAG: AraC family transcriptional regulator [Pseudomonadota bacterium]